MGFDNASKLRLFKNELASAAFGGIALFLKTTRGANLFGAGATVRRHDPNTLVITAQTSEGPKQYMFRIKEGMGKL